MTTQAMGIMVFWVALGTSGTAYPWSRISSSSIVFPEVARPRECCDRPGRIVPLEADPAQKPECFGLGLRLEKRVKRMLSLEGTASAEPGSHELLADCHRGFSHGLNARVIPHNSSEGLRRVDRLVQLHEKLAQEPKALHVRWVDRFKTLKYSGGCDRKPEPAISFAQGLQDFAVIGSCVACPFEHAHAGRVLAATQ
jgi:hypothetical protein